MGRRKIPIDTKQLIDLRREGKSIKEISDELGISSPTLSRRIAELENNEGIITKYREVQGLQLSLLQFRVLAAITPEKINNSSLVDLARSFYILKKAQLTIRGKREAKVSGLIQYLEELERREV